MTQSQVAVCLFPAIVPSFHPQSSLDGEGKIEIGEDKKQIIR